MLILFLFSELTLLRDVVSLDLKELEQSLNGGLFNKLTRAVSELDLKLWLEDQNLEREVLSVLLEEGLNSRQHLCALQLDDALQVRPLSLSPPSLS